MAIRCNAFLTMAAYNIRYLDGPCDSGNPCATRELSAETPTVTWTSQRKR